MQNRAGQQLAHFRLVELLGAGGMGEVWKAVDTTLDREVALKLLPAEVAGDPDRLARFEREAKTLAALNHPNIATLHGLHEDQGTHFLAMEMIPGEDLACRLARGPLALPAVKRIAEQIAEALEATHERDVIHRDLKPANVQITPQGRVKLLDFGLAKGVPGVEGGPGAAEDLTSAPTRTSAPTQMGVLLGTAAYMSPEQARGRPIDRRTDIWAFGCLLFEMLTGCPAFDGDTFSDKLAAVLKDAPDWAALPAALPHPLRALMQQCLSKSAADRPAGFDAVRARLAAAWGDGGDEARGASEWSPSMPPGRPDPATQAVLEPAHESLSRATPTAPTEPPSAAPSKTGRSFSGLAAAVFAIAAVIVAIVGAYRWLSGDSETTPATAAAPTSQGARAATTEVPAARPSIAVLPFRNLSADPDNEYFSDGMTEEIIGTLARIDGLRVAARSSSFVFKGQSPDAATVGKALNVDTVLDGSVQRDGDRIRISAQLVKVEDGFQLWSERYDRTFEDVFALQDEIARAIAGQLKVTLSVHGGESLAGRPTDNLEAYDLFLQGRFFWELRGDGLRKGLEFYQRAVKLDPDFALAHASIAETYSLMGFYNLMPPHDAMPLAKLAARRALELDGTLARAHSALGYIRHFYDWDFDAARASYVRAIELEPNYPTSRYWYAILLWIVDGQWETAAAEIDRSIALDPLALQPRSVEAVLHILGGEFERAAEIAESVVERNPKHFPGQWELVASYRDAGEYAKANATFEAAMALFPRHPWLLAEIGVLKARIGETAQAEALHDELMQMAETRFISPYFLALIPLELGRTDEALTFMEQMLVVRDPFAVMFARAATLAPLRDEPRFRDLLEQVGLD